LLTARLVREPSVPVAWRTFKLAGPYLLAVLAGLVLSSFV
jgi:hypothetical protein